MTTHGERGVRFPRHPGMWILLFVAVAFLVANPLLAWAHVDPPTAPSISPQAPHDIFVANARLPSSAPMSLAPPGVLLTCLLLVLIATAMVRGLPHWRRVAALGLVLVLGVFTFVIAIHAVHHLSEPAKAAECPVFSASQHVTGAPAETSDLYIPTLVSTASSSVYVDKPILPLSFHPALPRAPPSCPA
jgi:hypothetical protein